MTNSANSNGRQQVAIIGAGPIGLEAALYGVNAGYDVSVYEQGRVAENVRNWGHVTLFSPFGMNSSRWGRKALIDEDSGIELPDENEILTGREYAERYLLPLGRLPQLSNILYETTRVHSIGRRTLGKAEEISRPSRLRDGFELLIEHAGDERMDTADFVLDCSGTYPQHNWIGAGGIPCLGERSLAGEIDYGLPDICGRQRPDYSGKTTLVVGGGYSAATAVVNLVALAEEEPGTKVVWITRGRSSQPLTVIEGDALPERYQLTCRANELATRPHTAVRWLSDCHIEGVQKVETPRAGFRVQLRVGVNSAGSSDEDQHLHVDRIIGNVGYRPDLSLFEELQVHICYATQGPIKLAASLLADNSIDCLQQASPDAEMLKNPEPGFFILGAKSYGRNPRFLIRTGLDQIQQAYGLIQESSN